MKIRKLQKKDIVQVASLTSKTFAKFNNKEGTKKAIQRYIDHYNPKQNLERLTKFYLKDQIALVATSNDKIIGIIRGNKNRITNLYVSGTLHKKGIGGKILAQFESQSRKLNSKYIKVNASLFATPFYQKHGYKKTTGIRNMKGIKVQPMIKKLL